MEQDRQDKKEPSDTDKVKKLKKQKELISGEKDKFITDPEAAAGRAVS
jgi:hypothetical protein